MTNKEALKRIKALDELFSVVKDDLSLHIKKYDDGEIEYLLFYNSEYADYISEEQYKMFKEEVS